MNGIFSLAVSKASNLIPKRALSGWCCKKADLTVSQVFFSNNAYQKSLRGRKLHRTRHLVLLALNTSVILNWFLIRNNDLAALEPWKDTLSWYAEHCYFLWSNSFSLCWRWQRLVSVIDHCSESQSSALGASGVIFSISNEFYHLASRIV